MKYLPVTTFALLAACGASTGPTYVQPAPIIETATSRADTTLTPMVEVPDFGGAQYRGGIGFGPGQVNSGADARVVGDLSVNVDFGRNAISGRADQFVDRLTGERLGGDLEADLRIYRDAEDTASDAVAGFTDGTLFRPNGTRVDVELDTFGDFYGTSGRRIAGTVEGDASGLALTPDSAVSGVFDVRR